MPTLEERFGIQVERELKVRGWSSGTGPQGSIALKVHPVPKGKKIHYSPPKKYAYPASYEVKTVNVSIIVPSHSHAELQNQIIHNLGELYPDADVQLKMTEDSGADSKWYVLLVAESQDGIRWASDILASLPKKSRSADIFRKQTASRVCRQLYEEISLGGQVDEHLQDQLVAIQALCDGYSSFPRGEHPRDTAPELTLTGDMNNLSLTGGRVRKEKALEPFGNGSMHTQTVRWVASEVLPATEFYSKGDIVKGVGFSL